MRIITKDDFIDIYQKMLQRGAKFIFSKFNLNNKSRTLSAFDDTAIHSANWWIVPKVKERWNKKITDSADIDYETYCINKYFYDKKKLKILSLGAGICSHEIKFAASGVFEKVTCVDIADNLLRQAQQHAAAFGLQNMEFLAEDIYKLTFSKGQYDVVLFHSSLHHFSNIAQLLTEKIKYWLAEDGILLIHEYVGPDRLQFESAQIQAINKGLLTIPSKFRLRFKSNMEKKSFTGSGWLRMVLADPTECVESSKILPALRKHFMILEEKPIGGNLLMNILKDIAHHFTNQNNEEANRVLEKLFEMEDDYLQNHNSDFIFAVYSNSR